MDGYFLVLKLSVPGQEELAIDAIASNDIMVLNKDIVQQLLISRETIQHVKAEQEKILKERDLRYCGHRPAPNIKDKIIILIDDGIATGATMRVMQLRISQSTWILSVSNYRDPGCSGIDYSGIRRESV
ncbi:hypothetical protein [Coxiella-like endosymbiont]|uniref:hypothetical protein n=1 Tax=Coxiella-like endosymbiont TaxID=1592897 RepID=UPI0034E216F9